MTLRFPTRLKHLLSAAHLALGAIFLTNAVPVAQAQSGYPIKPIRVIVPFAAGGVADITIRIVAEKLGDNLGQRLVIENMPGAGGVVAARAVLSSQPDGYTLALLSNGTAVSVPLFKNLPFDPVKNFAPISSIGFFDFIVGTNTNSQHKTLADVIKFARDNPGKLNVGTISVGSTQNLSGRIAQIHGRDQLPDRALSRNAGSHCRAAARRHRCDDRQLCRDEIRAAGWQDASVGTTGESRSVILKDVPTMIEGGVKGYDVVSWNALFAPSGTPPEAIARLNAGLREVLAMPDVKQKLLDLGIEAKASSPEELKARLVDDIAEVDRRDREGRNSETMTKPTVPGPDPHTKVPKFRLPPLACDAHTHIFGPGAKYPYVGSYIPPDAPLEDFQALHKKLGIGRAVIVNASVHGTDNRVALDAIAVSGGRYRAVANIDGTITENGPARTA